MGPAARATRRVAVGHGSGRARRPHRPHRRDAGVRAPVDSRSRATRGPEDGGRDGPRRPRRTLRPGSVAARLPPASRRRSGSRSRPARTGRRSRTRREPRRPRRSGGPVRTGGAAGGSAGWGAAAARGRRLHAGGSRAGRRASADRVSGAHAGRDGARTPRCGARVRVDVDARGAAAGHGRAAVARARPAARAGTGGGPPAGHGARDDVVRCRAVSGRARDVPPARRWPGGGAVARRVAHRRRRRRDGRRGQRRPGAARRLAGPIPVAPDGDRDDAGPLRCLRARLARRARSRGGRRPAPYGSRVCADRGGHLSQRHGRSSGGACSRRVGPRRPRVRGAGEIRDRDRFDRSVSVHRAASRAPARIARPERRIRRPARAGTATDSGLDADDGPSQSPRRRPRAADRARLRRGRHASRRVECARAAGRARPVGLSDGVHRSIRSGVAPRHVERARRGPQPL